MSCTESIKMRDRNAAQTKQVDRCWILPANFSIEAGARFDPRALGWQEDVNCINYNSSSTDCSGCDGGDSTRPARSAATQLLGRIDGTFRLLTSYGVVADTLVYRLARTARPAETIWSAQTGGGARTFAIEYRFLAGVAYTLTVERVGKPSSQVIESDLSLQIDATTTPEPVVDLFVEVDADDFGDVAVIDIPVVGLPALQRKVVSSSESRDTSRVNISARYEDSTGMVYLTDAGSLDKMGRGNEYNWRYFVEDQWLTPEQFASFPRPRNFPLLVLKILTNTSLPVNRWRDQTVLAHEDQFFLRFI